MRIMHLCTNIIGNAKSGDLRGVADYAHRIENRAMRLRDELFLAGGEVPPEYEGFPDDFAETRRALLRAERSES